jgi:membrane-bound lytic murein transglycosylase D
MIAAARIGKDPARYGFTNLRYQAPLTYEEVVVPGGVGFEEIADHAGVAVEEVEELNAHFVREETPVSADWIAVRLPAGTADEFRGSLARAEAAKAAGLGVLASAALEEPQSASADGWATYSVRSGDTLWDIARKYQVGVSDLRKWNSLRSSRIKPGQELRVPAA